MIPIEKKIKIVERLLNGESQEKVASAFRISTGEASNIWNDFKNGRIVPGEVGMLSDELLGIARISKDSNMSPGDAANLIALGKVQKDSGVDLEVLSKVSLQMKGLDEMEQLNTMNTLMDIQKIKKPGESVLEAEKRFVNEKKEAERAEKNRVEMQSAIEELIEKKENLSQEISLGMEVSKITGLKDEKNVAAIIKAVRGFSTKDDFLYMAKVFDSAMREGVSADDMVRNAKIIEEAEKRGFSLRLIEGVNEECKRKAISFDEFLREMISKVQDRNKYDQDLNNKRKEAADLSTKLAEMREELANSDKRLKDIASSLKEAEKTLSDRNVQLKHIGDQILKGNENLSQLGREITEREASLRAKMKDEDFASRGISELKQLEADIKSKKEMVNNLEGVIAGLRDEMTSKTHEINMANGFMNLIAYGDDSDRKILLYYVENFLENVKKNGSKLPTKEIRGYAFRLLLNLGKEEIPVIHYETSGLLKIIDSKDYQEMVESANKLKEDLKDRDEKLRGIINENRELKHKVEYFGNDVENFVLKQLSSDNPDKVVLDAIQNAAVKYLESQNRKGNLERNVDSILDLATNLAKAMRGRNDSDRRLHMMIMKSGNKEMIEASISMGEILRAMATGENVWLQGYEASPCQVLAGYLSGGLVLDKGKFLLPRDFVRIGQRIERGATIGVRKV